MFVTDSRRGVAFLLSMLLTISCAAPFGCGESAPPPVSAGELDEAKKNREVIIQKEYGGGAASARPKKK